MKHIPMKTMLLSLLLALTSAGWLRAEADLDSNFTNPSAMARPKTWWHWISGNVSKEGITADLEAMKRIGLSGAQIFTVNQSEVRGPVAFMSPEWRELIKHAMSEAARLKLDISIVACDGWSESGGTWVTPAQSMQRLTWTERQVRGGKTIPLAVPQPQATRDYYNDIALFALKDVAGEILPDPVKVTASPQLEKLMDTMPSAEEPMKFLGAKGEAPFWIQYEYAEPITIGSVTAERVASKGFPPFDAVLECSMDGVKYRGVSKLSRNDFLNVVPKAKGRFFRVTFAQGLPKWGWKPQYLARNTLTVSRFTLGGVRIDNLAARTGMHLGYRIPFAKDPLPAMSAGDIVDLTGKITWDAPAGTWTLIRMGHTSTGSGPHPSTSGGLECDKLSATAVNSHINNMYNPIWEDSPGKAGSTFKFFLLDSWEAGRANWTPLMAEEFKQRRGYDLRPWLPALTGRIIGSIEETQRFHWDFRQTMAYLLAENHYGVFQKRAREKGMNLMAEGTGGYVSPVNDQLLNYKYCGVPMGEFWFVKTREIDLDGPRPVASAAHIYGQNLAACEAFTSRPEDAAWKGDPYALKPIGDKAFCHGFNLFCFHRYAHQPWLDRKPGMCMGKWGMNFERTITWWNQGGAWIDYLSRCQALLQHGRFYADLCYFYGEGASVFFRQIDLKPTVPKGYDYDVCNADAILNLMETKDGRVATPSGMSYRVLILPELDRMTLPLLQKIAKLVHGGATVYGPKPLRSPSLSGYPEADKKLTQLANEVWGNCDGQTVTEHAYGAGKIVWGVPLEKVLGVPPDFSAAQGDFMSIHRKAPQVGQADADVYFVSNQEQRALTVDCSFRVTGKIPELWYPDSGRKETVALYTTKDGRTTIPLQFDPFGSVFVIFRTPQSPAPHPVSVTPEASLRTDAQTQTTLSTTQNGDYRINWSHGSATTVAVKDLPAPLVIEGAWNLAFPPFAEGKGQAVKTAFDKLISWTESTNDTIKYFSGTATYSKTFTLPKGYLAKNRRLALDLGTVKNLAEVTINGKPLGILWKEPFQADITEVVKEGENTLRIEITNLWPNRLIGDQKLEEKDRLTWSSFTYYKATDPLLPSGLFGPVAIRTKAVVPLPENP